MEENTVIDGLCYIYLNCNWYYLLLNCQVGIGFGIYLLITAKNEQQPRKIIKRNLKIQVLVPSIIIGLTYGASNGFFARHYLKNLLDGFDSFDLDQIEFIMWKLTIASVALMVLYPVKFTH